MRFAKTAIISTLMLSLILPSLEAGARVGGRSSSMSSSRSMSAPYSAPQRVGGGADAGMQRQDVMNRTRSQDALPQSAPAPQSAMTPAPAQQPARQGFGVGSMVGAAAAGAAVGYLANSAMHNNQPVATSGNPMATDQRPATDHGSSSPWGFVLLLLAGTAAIMAVLSMLSRRRETAERAAGPLMRSVTAPAAGSATNLEQQEFERNALKFFNDLQDANNRGDIAHIQQYVAAPLRDQLIADIEGRAAPSRTQVMTMKAQRVDLTEEVGRSIASVRFRGMISENENMAPEQIDEVWHFTKASAAGSQWQLAGIEQI